MTTAPSGPVCTSGGVLDGIRHVPPGPELACLGADPESHGTAEHEAELLVLVAVLRHDRVRLELDDREAQPLAVHGSAPRRRSRPA